MEALLVTATEAVKHRQILQLIKNGNETEISLRFCEACGKTDAFPKLCFVRWLIPAGI